MAATHIPRHRVTARLRVGLGWHISRPVDRDLAWHNGQTGGSHGFIGLDKARLAAVVVLSNSVSSIDDIGFHLLDARVEPAAAEEREELTLTSRCWRATWVSTSWSRRDGDGDPDRARLVAEATGLGVAPIYAASETDFFVKAINVQLSFQRDATGAVTGLVLHHAGKDLPGTKLR